MPCRAADAFTVLVTREPEWDDQTRERALGLAAYEAALCPCGCGLPIEESSKDQPFLVDHFTCFATRAKERLREQDAKQAKAEKRPDGWDAGRIYYIRDVNPEEAPRGN